MAARGRRQERVRRRFKMGLKGELVRRFSVSHQKEGREFFAWGWRDRGWMPIQRIWFTPRISIQGAGHDNNFAFISHSTIYT